MASVFRGLFKKCTTGCLMTLAFALCCLSILVGISDYSILYNREKKTETSVSIFLCQYFISLTWFRQGDWQRNGVTGYIVNYKYNAILPQIYSGFLHFTHKNVSGSVSTDAALSEWRKGGWLGVWVSFRIYLNGSINLEQVFAFVWMDLSFIQSIEK